MKGSCLLIADSGLLHFTIVDETSLDAPGAAVADKLRIGGTSRYRALHVGHHVETECAVTDEIQKGRVVEYHGGIIVCERHILSTQGSSMGAGGQSEEIERSLTVLRLDGKRK